MNQPKELNLSKGRFLEFILFHLTPAGWRLKRLVKEGFLEFRRDKETGRVYVHPTKKAAEYMATRGVESCLGCIEKPRVKSVRHHTFLTQIGWKFRRAGYPDFKIDPMCPHRPERNLRADARLTTGQAKIGIMLETGDTQKPLCRIPVGNFDGILIFIEDLDLVRLMMDPAGEHQKVCFVGLAEFLRKGMGARAAVMNGVAGETVEDFLRLIEAMASSKN